MPKKMSCVEERVYVRWTKRPHHDHVTSVGLSRLRKVEIFYM